MIVKHRLSMALLVGVGSTLVGCQAPLGKLAFWKNGDSAVASSAPGTSGPSYENLAKEFGGAGAVGSGAGGSGGMAPLGGTKPASTAGPVVSTWNKTTGAIASAFTIKPKVETDDPTSLLSKTGKIGPDVHISAAGLMESQNRTAEAIAHYEKALAIDAKNERALVSLARLHDRQGNSVKAIELYQRALKAHPKSAVVHNDLGLCYARQKQWPKAADSLNKAIQLQPRNAMYRNNLATVLVETGRTDEAFKQLTAANSQAVAHFNLGYLLQQKGQTEAAIRHLQQAVSMDASLAPAHEMLAQLTGQSAPALEPQAGARIAAQSVSTPSFRNSSDFQWLPSQSDQQAIEPPASGAPVHSAPLAPSGSGGSYHVGDDIGPVQSEPTVQDGQATPPADSGAASGIELLPPIEG